MARLRVAALALSCLPLAGLSYARAAAPQPGPTATAAAASPAPTPRFGDEIAVRLVTVVVRVVDGAGNPILGLAPGDFHVRVGRREVPVAAVDWIAGGEAAAVGQAAVHAPEGPEHPFETSIEPPALASVAAPLSPSAEPAAEPSSPAAAAQPPVPAAAGEPTAPAAAESPAPAPAPAAPPAGKLVVIFVQADSNAPSRTRGHLHTLPFTRELLAALGPEDNVAVVGFDSHLKLWQDFTRDREPVPEAIYQAIRFGGRPPEPAAGGIPSLARHFDFDAARRAASPERALQVTAEALAGLPGEKVMVFLAWGLGNFGSMGTHMTPAFAPAVRALLAARTAVFVLDVTEADAHDLEIGLQGIAEATGGTYDKTNVFPALAVRQLARTISGYYVLTLDADALPSRGGEVAVELRGRKGNVLLRPTSLAANAAAPAG